MSYYVPTYSYQCLKLLIKKYNFRSYDYGSEKINNYADSLPEDYFMSISQRWHKGYSDFADLLICDKQKCNLKHYIFKDDREGFQMLINDKKYKYMEVDAEEYADYLYNYVLTPERLIPRIANFIKAKMEKEEQYRLEREKREYPYYPNRWTPEERIEKYVKYIYDYKDDTRSHSDDYKEYESYTNFIKAIKRLEKAMTKREIKRAATLYRKRYRRNLFDDRIPISDYSDRITEGVIEDIKNKFDRKINMITHKPYQIEYTPENSKKIYNTNDILLLNSKRFQNKFEQFIIQASIRGNIIDNYYRDSKITDLPPVAYDKGKFYVKTMREGWVKVNFNYERINF